MAYSNYYIGDALIRIKNACMAKQTEVVVPNTKIVRAVMEVLKREKFVESVNSREGGLEVKLKTKKGQSLVTDIKLMSKPGRRLYLTRAQIKAKKGFATLILSTSKGVKSGKEALKENQGGELIAEVS
ncbi:30S ribosomal protein S8 [Candidatus Woesebacteria bacterium RIFCSPHIGHO2_02_FULL_42_20]|uniref:Small ribosomal subunit protein uS8 n=1 Tax=Candidatus Woesebacteria bacterium RIFCSPHIGHO2_12_FULL_41_24 TaxID=1802510 RepID=A0A1F8AR49_9BACT|nr:MAG: 30S ribosomal protein S8 [Candidatus Woesebacteria bacterium RBG_16_41_13]OGM29248.1 MAG: 30S ribosomal protein S8 [Candidatus Woesebacteria bacterium RIFCSPHIGHO2_01_FULL_42_80]OGM34746.1 MAG: 30S ribosomal protein S8 [Candidatus Woesebacteria bacterium RIFCSPHIGHO2_02_FULL_42_20]OGM53665.1 MAG: 30S ribosomal protein S8 [Candidatus Woesebacteria bacterium RIFCSPHIGHO2_12_FULL_41_24]OGM67045.1 MAG: 30S ribosomal protein S8 [Candidatus Woesebacteria bacterium RIFCSPLOWO2_01_FULL_42_67]O